MATIKYRIKGRADPASIFFRFRDGRETDLEATTNINVLRKNWNESKEKVKTVSDVNYAEINSKLYIPIKQT
jgi:hypothetical protein